MDKEKVLNVIENSFLKDYLKEDVTDISYNGENFFYVSNIYGRKKCEIKLEQDYVKDFIRQLANVTEKQFSYQCPILDVSAGKYRISAIHQSIGKINDTNVCTFSLRIASEKPRIDDNSNFVSNKLKCLFKTLMMNHKSIIIAGVTGSGKTEFQKYLLSLAEENSRMIVIDSVMELDCLRKYEHVDLTLWQPNNNVDVSISSLIAVALRNNPDWLVVSEARGKEMLDVLNSAMTGTPIITTLHSLDCKSTPYRMARMIMSNSGEYKMTDVLSDIYYHFICYVYLEKTVLDDGSIYRYISEVCLSTNDGKFIQIYKCTNNKEIYGKLSKTQLNSLNLNADSTFIKYFGVN